MQDEDNVVRRAQEGDEEALTQLYEENFDRIYRYVVLKIGDRTEAEDITQQVFLNCVKSIRSFKKKGFPFSAWLYRIAHNQIVDYLRKKTKQATTPIDDMIPDGARDSDPGQIAELNVEIDSLIAATKQLTQAQQEVISLRFTTDLSVAEVARITGKSEGAVKALQHSAIVALRKIMG
ncbi:MAG: sigma-70 family RNA polymerase sigma factor [Chloroflexi bacterium]|nr:sigma-70 family RNA polymerase sigma factor [Chloroflexota bacterium]